MGTQMQENDYVIMYERSLFH